MNYYFYNLLKDYKSNIFFLIYVFKHILTSIKALKINQNIIKLLTMKILLF
ncbi:hypothetical protein BSPA14S_H0035 (plasmid) [Borreliella spielmanii A14S]|uniref:Uncharacterized protein n=1 Tax=Borreliella spielmanii A14S TaxID=498742 RepID=C0RCG1_9SPIR|nr:hypothetical protein BSPA14S_H0035 [Borreliella spielmanii A14S]